MTTSSSAYFPWKKIRARSHVQQTGTRLLLICPQANLKTTQVLLPLISGEALQKKKKKKVISPIDYNYKQRLYVTTTQYTKFLSILQG